jgi:hypothetical protein
MWEKKMRREEENKEHNGKEENRTAREKLERAMQTPLVWGGNTARY